MHRTLQTTETVPKSTTVGKRGCQHDWRREEAMPRLALTRLRSLAGTVKLRVAASFAEICVTILTLLTFALQPWRTCVSRARAWCKPSSRAWSGVGYFAFHPWKSWLILTLAYALLPKTNSQQHQGNFHKTSTSPTPKRELLPNQTTQPLADTSKPSTTSPSTPRSSTSTQQPTERD